MLILGIIFTLAGVMGTYYVKNEMSKMDYALGSILGSEDAATIDMLQTVFVAALVLGIIFLIIGIVKLSTKRERRAMPYQSQYPSPSPYSPPAQSPALKQPAVVCSNCGEALGAREVFCHNCGTKRESAPNQDASAPISEPVCSSCGRTLIGNAAFCGNCGAKR